MLVFCFCFCQVFLIYDNVFLWWGWRNTIFVISFRKVLFHFPFFFQLFHCRNALCSAVPTEWQKLRECVQVTAWQKLNCCCFLIAHQSHPMTGEYLVCAKIKTFFILTSRTAISGMVFEYTWGAYQFLGTFAATALKESIICSQLQT